MPSKTLFFVQPYVVKRHKLAASGAVTFTEQDQALEAGAALARKRAGVVVLAQSYDPARQVLNKPTVLRIHGRVPAAWSADRLAA